ncbi:nudix hydrolase 8-like [Rhodamnia argentea]|uniref:Nudix hydrolase 8-like n=1 Tax=Rhodamnia argentea TaxID=178133 RepID=A0A8B8P5Z2_9MYRT|nr:nudix hydrolase 8-like [Rhodamnia argentea]
MAPAAVLGRNFLGFRRHELLKEHRVSRTEKFTPYDSSRDLPWKTSPLKTLNLTFSMGDDVIRRNRIHVVLPDISTLSWEPEVLDAWDDEYGGVVINPWSLPSSANAFASALKTSLFDWKLKGKRGIWLKILEEQADLVPIAIQEGFKYHHAETGFLMLTYWIPDEPCLLPAGPSHQIGVGGFAINDKREVLVVKEKCSCSSSDVWKLPTGYINKSEDLFSGAVREVKEETGVDTAFLEMVAFRHVHLVAFEKSDLLFVCMLKPLSSDIAIDDKEIQAAKWMAYDEFIGQPYYQEDHMLKKAMELCMEAYEDRYCGFIAHQLPSKLDGKLSYLYYYGGPCKI